MGELKTKPPRDYALPTTSGIQSAIVMPTIGANNFEIKPAIIQMMQNFYAFRGMPDDDPNLHLASFLEVCETFKINGVTADAIRMRLFPFSLKDRAKEWLQSMPHESITTWEDLAMKFLARFFPPARTAKLRLEINNFGQYEMESLYEAWERFKDLLRKCPHHGMPKWLISQTFYNGLNASNQL